MADDFPRDAGEDVVGNPDDPPRRSEQTAARYQRLLADQRIEMYEPVRRC